MRCTGKAGNDMMKSVNTLRFRESSQKGCVVEGHPCNEGLISVVDVLNELHTRIRLIEFHLKGNGKKFVERAQMYYDPDIGVGETVEPGKE